LRLPVTVGKSLSRARFPHRLLRDVPRRTNCTHTSDGQPGCADSERLPAEVRARRLPNHDRSADAQTQVTHAPRPATDQLAPHLGPLVSRAPTLRAAAARRTNSAARNNPPVPHRPRRSPVSARPRVPGVESPGANLQRYDASHSNGRQCKAGTLRRLRRARSPARASRPQMSRTSALTRQPLLDGKPAPTERSFAARD